MSNAPEIDYLKEANSLVEYMEQANGVGEDKIYEVSFDIEDWQYFTGQLIDLVRRANEAGN